MKLLTGIFVLFFTVSFLHAQKLLEFQNYGFAIEELPFRQDAKDEVSQNLVMYLPSEGENFMPNINVQMQHFPAGIEEYIELSKDQFEQAGIELIKNERKSNVLTFEYSALLNGLSLHVYSKAHFSGPTIYLVTATALETQWNKNENVLKRNVDSFRILKSKNK